MVFVWQQSMNSQCALYQLRGSWQCLLADVLAKHHSVQAYSVQVLAAAAFLADFR
jgi:hypothetical protein